MNWYQSGRAGSGRISGAALLLLSVCCGTAAAQRGYRLPDLGERFGDRVIWGARAAAPDGFQLAFGGQDQVAEDGRPPTRIQPPGGEWTAIDAALRRDNPLEAAHQTAVAARRVVKDALARLRAAWFEDLPSSEAAERLTRERSLVDAAVQNLAATLNRAGKPDRLPPERAAALQQAKARVASAARLTKLGDLSPGGLSSLWQSQIAIEQAADQLAAAPSPRALSPLVYEPASKRFMLFGGDHLDYLTNDLWAFDPAARRWSRLPVRHAPPPRADHTLRAAGDGKLVLTGGYTYTSNTDYLGGQYRDLDDGSWTYDVKTQTWSGAGTAADADERVYRSGPFHPEFYLHSPPDRAAHRERLASLPANEWVKLDPPHLPRLNRDWGTAVLDHDRDLILRYSGGHSAHGGTDVLHYHLATNRWELCWPVEFPLGQLYANTRYPNGRNFNGRPWITGHTYQNYGYDPLLKKLLFTGRPRHYYLYDIDRGEWADRRVKPPGMIYNSCFYTLTLTPTPTGLHCWTKQGELFHFDAGAMQWKQLELQGEPLPAAVVDNSTAVYDGRRNRLLMFVKGYGRQRVYDGRIYACDLSSRRVSKLSPAGAEAASAVPYLCQIRYDSAADLLLVGGTLPAGDDGLRRTPAYDPAGNRWISLKLTGDDPSGAKGRNVSLGLMYDARRRLFWAVDTNSQVYTLRLDPAAADVRPLDG